MAAALRISFSSLLLVSGVACREAPTSVPIPEPVDESAIPLEEEPDADYGQWRGALQTLTNTLSCTGAAACGSNPKTPASPEVSEAVLEGYYRVQWMPRTGTPTTYTRGEVAQTIVFHQLPKRLDGDGLDPSFYELKNDTDYKLRVRLYLKRYVDTVGVSVGVSLHQVDITGLNQLGPAIASGTLHPSDFSSAPVQTVELKFGSADAADNDPLYLYKDTPYAIVLTPYFDPAITDSAMLDLERIVVGVGVHDGAGIYGSGTTDGDSFFRQARSRSNGSAISGTKWVTDKRDLAFGVLFGRCKIGTAIYQAGDLVGCKVCDPFTSTTELVNADLGTGCNLTTCRTGEICTDGVCGGGSPVNDGDPCTDIDPVACREDPVCAAGTCVPGAPVPDGPSCSDNKFCTNDLCTAGACVHTPACPDDGRFCTDDSCDEDALGACLYDPKPVDTPCDGSYCFTDMACTASGDCGGGDERVCELEADASPECQEVLSACSEEEGCVRNIREGLSCNVAAATPCSDSICQSGRCVAQPKTIAEVECDGDLCTERDSCDAGVCRSGAPMTCEDDHVACTNDFCVNGECHSDNCPAADDCHRGGICNKTTQLCESGAPLAGECDDGFECSGEGPTETAQCSSGACVPGQCKVLISAIRTRNLNGDASTPFDDVIEVFNPGPTPVNLFGYQLRRSNSTSTGAKIETNYYTFDDYVASAYGVTNIWLPVGASFLINAYGTGAAYTVADVQRAAGSDRLPDASGFALMNSSSTGLTSTAGLLDAVSFTYSSLYREGTPLVPMTTLDDRKQYRRVVGESYLDVHDTGDNSADFAKVPEQPQGYINSRMLSVTPGVDLRTAHAYRQPAVSADVAVALTASTGLAVGDSVYVQEAKSHYQVRTLVAPSEASDGGSLAYFTTPTFSQPSLNATVAVGAKSFVGATFTLGAPVFVGASKSAYIVTAVTATQVTLMLTGINQGGTASGGTVTCYDLTGLGEALGATSASFTQPASAGSSVTVAFVSTANLSVNRLVYLDSASSVYQVTAIASGTSATLKLIKNNGSVTTVAPTTARSAARSISATLEDKTTTGAAFTQPSPGTTVSVAVGSTTGLGADDLVYLGGSVRSVYLVASVADATHVTLRLVRILSGGLTSSSSAAVGTRIYRGSPAYPMVAALLSLTTIASGGAAAASTVATSALLRPSDGDRFTRAFHFRPDRTVRWMTLRNYHATNPLSLSAPFVIEGDNAALFAVESGPSTTTSLSRCDTGSGGLPTFLEGAVWPPVSCATGSTLPVAIRFNPPAGGSGASTASAVLKIAMPAASVANTPPVASCYAPGVGASIPASSVTIKLFGRY